MLARVVAGERVDRDDRRHAVDAGCSRSACAGWRRRCCTSSGFSASRASGSGLPATIRCLPECALSARTVATTTAASGTQPGRPALDVEEPLGAHVGAEAGLGDEEVAGVDADQVGEDRGVAVRDVAERAGVHQHRRVLQASAAGSASSRRARIAAIAPAPADVLGRDRRRRPGCSRRRCGRAAPAGRPASVASARIAITSEAAVMSKPVWRVTPSTRPPRPMTMLRSARSLTSSTRRQVMSCRSRPSCVALVQVVVEHRGQQVVGRGDGVEVAGQVQVERPPSARPGCSRRRPRRP